LTRIGLGIPPLDAESQAAYLRGDPEFLQRVMRAHDALVEPGDVTNDETDDES
jgi:hypothetical protein